MVAAPLTDKQAELLDGTEPVRQEVGLGSRLQSLEVGGTRMARIRLTHEQFHAAVISKQIVLPALSETQLVRLVDLWLALVEEFGDGIAATLTAAFLEVGESYTPDPNGLLPAVSLFTGVGVGPKALAPGDKGPQIEPGETSLLYPGENLTAVLTVSGADLDTLVSGVVDVIVVYQALDTPAVPRS